MTAARWIAPGVMSPAGLHAAYAGIAEAMAPGDRPVVLWARASAHLCIGQGQCAARIATPAADVPVVRRALGGGAVWIDERQYCYALIAPLALLPGRPADWPAWGFAPAIEVHEDFGLAVERVGEDLWHGGRKIAGSGAATIGNAGVFASSFLIEFPARRFAAAIRCPSADLQARLADALPRAMTDWVSHRIPPGEPALARAFRDALRRHPGWVPAASLFSEAEARAGAEAAAECALDDAWSDSREADPGPACWTIKLNARSHLTAVRRGPGVRPALVLDGRAVHP